MNRRPHPAVYGCVRDVLFDPGAWRLSAHEHRAEEHLGRPSLVLRGGFAVLDGVGLQDGVVEVDVAFGRERSFVGCVWRVADDQQGRRYR